MSTVEVEQSAADRAFAEAEAQGLPARVTDASALAVVAGLLLADTGRPVGNLDG